MAIHPQVWLQNEAEERPITVSALTLDCPFCGQQLGSVVRARVVPGWRCSCGAQVTAISDDELAPTPPAVLAQAFREVRRRLAERVVGHEGVLARLALMGAKHLHHGGRQRGLIIGPSGVGKTSLAVALAEALECPAIVWDASVSSEVGWSGVSIAEVMAEMYTSYDRDVLWMSRGILIADEICKLAVRRAEGSAREHRLGQQKSLLGLLGGGPPVRFLENGDKGRPLTVSTDHMLIIGLGAFHDLPEDPGPSELIAYGYMPEFASRFPVILTLDRLEVGGLVQVFRREIEPALTAAQDFGYRIEVPDAVLFYIATAVAEGSRDVTPRAGAGWLVSAIDMALVRLLDLDARPGTQLILRADDVPIPAAIARVRAKLRTGDGHSKGS
jgi:DNA polymerase III delta prime subunit